VCVKAVNFSGSPIIVVHMLPFDSGFTNILQDNFSAQVLFFLIKGGFSMSMSYT
jgi:hypothetical protein